MNDPPFLEGRIGGLNFIYLSTELNDPPFLEGRIGSSIYEVSDDLDIKYYPTHPISLARL